MNLKCINCGKEIKENNNYCTSCGCSVNSTVSNHNTVVESKNSDTKANNEGNLFGYITIILGFIIPLISFIFGKGVIKLIIPLLSIMISIITFFIGNRLYPNNKLMHIIKVLFIVIIFILFIFIIYTFFQSMKVV